MSVLVIGTNLTECANLLAYSAAGFIVGKGSVDTDCRCGLAVWGDDPVTKQVEGLRDGEVFELQLWDSGVESDLKSITFLVGDRLSYETDGLLIVEADAMANVPHDYFLSAAYPNPFNSAIRIDYGLTEIGEISLKEFDISGRFVSTLIDGSAAAGVHSVV